MDRRACVALRQGVVSRVALVVPVALTLAVVAFMWFRTRSVGATKLTPPIILLANLAAGGATLFLASILLTLLLAARFRVPDPLLGGFAIMSLLGVLRGTPRLAATLIRRYCKSIRANPSESDDRAIRTVIELFLAFVYGAVVVGVASQVEDVISTPLLLVPLVAFLPFLHSVLEPWLVALTSYKRQSCVASQAVVLQNRLDQLTQAAGVSSMRLILIPGNLANAYAMGVSLSTFVLVGENLVNRLSDRQLEAVMAHEIGHVARRHTWQLLVLSCFCAMGFALVLVPVFSLWNGGHILLGGILAAAGGAGINGILPGWVRRRQEFDADRYAARLLDGPTVADSLAAVGRAHKVDPDQGSLFYPSINDRIRAIAPVTA